MYAEGSEKPEKSCPDIIKNPEAFIHMDSGVYQ